MSSLATLLENDQFLKMTNMRTLDFRIIYIGDDDNNNNNDNII